MNSLTKTDNKSQSTAVTTVYVRYMVSLRCKMAARAELDKLGIKYLLSVKGAIEFPKGLTSNQKTKLKYNLRKRGLELLDTSECILIDKIIHTITDYIHNTDALPKISYKEIIHENLPFGSESILKIFSEVKGVSVTQFIIQEKIDRAKELLLYYDLTIAEISEKLNYKTQSYFVSQFKKHTGLSPAYFLEAKKRRDQIIREK